MAYIYRKTTILPTDSKDLAQTMLSEHILKIDWVLFVVLDRNTESETTVGRADMKAGSPGELRQVIWARKPDHVLALLQELKNETGTPIDWAKPILAVVTSMDDAIRYVHYNNNTPMNFTDVVKAFALGEQ